MFRAYQLRHLLLAAIAILLLAAVARAGDFPHERKGLLLGLTFGGANAELQYDRFGATVNRELKGGVTGGFLLGLGLSDQFVLGVEGHVFRQLDAASDTEMALSAISLTWFPGGGGFYLRGGVGSSVTTLDLPAPDGVAWQEREGDAGVFGIGYEWRLGRQFALGVGIDGYVSRFEDLPLFQDASFGFGSAALKLNWYL